MSVIYPNIGVNAYFDEKYPNLAIYRQENILKMQQMRIENPHLELPVSLEHLINF
jgi:hypothetical protein